jgi:hypothetical protein
VRAPLVREMAIASRQSRCHPPDQLCAFVGRHGLCRALGGGDPVGFSIATAFAFHANFADPSQIEHFLKNLAIAGGLLHVIVVGSGRYGLDGRRPVCTSLRDATASSFKSPLVASRNAFRERSR